MKKRGVVFGGLAELILLVVGAVFLLSLIYTAFSNVEEDISYSACHDAIMLQQDIRDRLLPGSEYIKPFPESCYPAHVEVKSENGEDAMLEILDLMETCQWMYGEGEFYPFDEEVTATIYKYIARWPAEKVNLEKYYPTYAMETSCAICMTFELTGLNAVDNAAGISQDEMFELIKKTKRYNEQPYYSYFNYPDVSKYYEVEAKKKSIQFSALTGTVLNFNSLKKGGQYAIAYRSDSKYPEMGHTTIEYLPMASMVCYPNPEIEPLTQSN